ncbi:hypothetical protein O0555_01675 [Brevibacillus laterosporus]|uniref:hypothetical protein n=1 Tax=Brevibacillus laterosporus TaxID=1465 RepID=UPI0018CF2213|nr:hypothetical protein [Brevibacillus laterosporus]MBG9798742.1 hypothetical protein [Brevibacillus laterosporus]MCR8936067.1 hypothetical protein [Brevibacillus laterosporus]MCZ0838706.1 hypothetical protein [Brevibacillus laterosporus]MCZ0843135.1 hypothetical protein [Brevibacillus laterosporus]MED1910486.1 hypothetical protein [Brevibacillus laterosporus]
MQVLHRNYSVKQLSSPLKLSLHFAVYFVDELHGLTVLLLMGKEKKRGYVSGYKPKGSITSII